MGHPTSLHSADDWDEITVLADTTFVDGSGNPITCRAIRCGTAGKLILRKPNGQTEAANFAAGETRSLRASAIVASGSSACVPIEVMF